VVPCRWIVGWIRGVFGQPEVAAEGGRKGGQSDGQPSQDAGCAHDLQFPAHGG
jgi:hypothetical protein